MSVQTSGPAASKAPPDPIVGAGEREPATPPVTGAPDTGADRHDPAPTTRPPTPTPPQEASSDAGHGRVVSADANRPRGSLSPRRPSGAFQKSRPADNKGKVAAGRAQLDPFLAAVVLRAWGLDDPRALPMLRAENQPGRTKRAEAVGKRARVAGWPATLSIDDAKKAASASLHRLEGVRYRWNGDRIHDEFQAAAYESRRRRGATAPWDDDTDDPARIFDE